MPEIDALASSPDTYPVTLMYLPLARIADALSYAASVLGHHTATTASYGALYSTQDEETRHVFAQELRLIDPRVRLVFCTWTVSMGFDSPCVERTIHGVPPRNLSDYIQEMGRACRRGQPSDAVLYFSPRDIAKNVKDLNDDIVKYCKSTEQCRREILLHTFGFSKGPDSVTGCHCCDICRTQCTCTNCASNR